MTLTRLYSIQTRKNRIRFISCQILPALLEGKLIYSLVKFAKQFFLTIKSFSYNVVNYLDWDSNPNPCPLPMSRPFEMLTVLLHELDTMDLCKAFILLWIDFREKNFFIK